MENGKETSVVVVQLKTSVGRTTPMAHGSYTTGGRAKLFFLKIYIKKKKTLIVREFFCAMLLDPSR
jgi:hypothetical protein